MKTFFISDLHLFHENALRFDQRPFANVEEMNAILYNNWNSVVTNEDFVYILGDISMKVNTEVIEYFATLKGHKILVKGNHDKLQDHRYRTLFDDVVDYVEIKVGVKQPDNQTKTINLVLSHYPILMWKNQHRGYVHLYGHVHNSDEENLYREALYRLIMSKWTDEEKILYGTNSIPLNRDKFVAFNVGAMMPYIDFTPRTFEEIYRKGKIYDSEMFAEFLTNGKLPKARSEHHRGISKEN